MKLVRYKLRKKAKKQYILNQLQPGVAYLCHLKTSLGFLIFSGDIDKQHRAAMG